MTAPGMPAARRSRARGLAVAAFVFLAALCCLEAIPPGRLEAIPPVEAEAARPSPPGDSTPPAPPADPDAPVAPPAGGDGEAAAAAPAADEPGSGDLALAVDEPAHDWGSVFHGEIVEHEFALENRGAEEIEIDEVRTSCSCTFAAGDVRGKRLAPGESAKISVRVETGRLPADQVETPDPIRKTAEVIGAGGKVLATLQLAGSIRRLLVFDPPAPRIVLIRDPDAPPPPPVKVSVRSATRDRTVKILEVASQKSVVAAALEEKEPGKSFELELTSKLGAADSAQRRGDSLSLRAVSDEISLDVSLEVVVEVKRRIECADARSFFFTRAETRGIGKDVPHPRKEIEIVSLGTPEHRFRIVDVSVESGRFAATIAPVEEGRRYKLTIECLPPPANAGRLLKDRIVVKTDDPLVPEISIPGSAQL